MREVINMKIGIDVDGVLVDMEGYQRKYGQIYFKKMFNKEIVNPDAYDIEQMFDCTHEQREKFWIKYIWAYCLKQPVIKDAPQIIEKLHNDNHTLVIITGRAHTTEKNITGKLFRQMLRHWLRKNKIQYDKIIYCSEKESSTDKLKICRHEKIDVMIDDKPENLLALKDRLKVICYPAVWNENLHDENIIKVSGWKDVYKKIGEIEEQK